MQHNTTRWAEIFRERTKNLRPSLVNFLRANYAIHEILERYIPKDCKIVEKPHSEE